MGRQTIGALRERLLLQTREPETITLTSLTRASTTATATTVVAHGYATGDYVTIAGADQSAYNGKTQITVTGTLTFTFTVSGSPASPATGAVTVVYASDAQGGRRDTWTDVATVAAELLPISATERLQMAGIQSETRLRFRVRARTDVTAGQRATWTPSWPPNAAAQTLEILGVLPLEDGRTWALLECARSRR